MVVGKYKMKILSNGVTRWIQKSVEGLGIKQVEVEEYIKIISNRAIKQSERTYKLIWAAANDGNYKVNDGYNTILFSQS